MTPWDPKLRRPQPLWHRAGWSCSRTCGSTRARRRGPHVRRGRWPALADTYVNDAFGTCHRDEASMVAVLERFPADRRAIGFLVEKELQILDTLLGQPQAAHGGA